MVKETLRKLKEAGFVNEDNEQEIFSALGEVACGSYGLGFSDGESKAAETSSWTSYGKPEDYFEN